MGSPQEVRRPENNAYQLKLWSAVSYYPKNGGIHVDCEAKGRKERVIDAVLEALAERDELGSLFRFLRPNEPGRLGQTRRRCSTAYLLSITFRHLVSW